MPQQQHEVTIIIMIKQTTREQKERQEKSDGESIHGVREVRGDGDGGCMQSQVQVEKEEKCLHH